MIVYQIINQKKDGNWHSPFVASVDMLESLAKVCTVGNVYIKEVTIEDENDSFVKDYAKNFFSLNKSNAQERAKTSIYPYNREKLSEKVKHYKRIEDLDPVKADKTKSFDRIYTVGLRKNGSDELQESYFTTRDYLLAREVAKEFQDRAPMDDIVVALNYLYLNSKALAKDLTVGELKNKNYNWKLGSVYDCEYAMALLENKRLEAELLSLQAKNETLRDVIDEYRSDAIERHTRERARRASDGTEQRKSGARNDVRILK